MKAEKLQKIFQIGLPPLAALLLVAVWLFFLPGGAIAKATVVPVIHEFAANHTGTDTNEFAQVKGSASTDYSTYNLLQDSNEIFITKSAPAQVLPGGTYTYTIMVENPFTYTLAGVMVGDLLPAGTSFVSALDGGVYTTTPFPLLSWSVGDLGPSASVDLRFVVTAPNFETTVANQIYEVGATNISAYT